MRLNSANRSFFTLAGIVLVPYALLGVFGCGLLSLVAYRLAGDGFAGLHRDGQDLRAAAAFFAVITTGTVVGLVSVRRQVRATRHLSRWVADRSTAMAPEVAACAARAGLDSRVVMLDEPHPCSFTFGVAPARVAISTGLAERVSDAELEAVLHHERGSAARRAAELAAPAESGRACDGAAAMSSPSMDGRVVGRSAEGGTPPVTGAPSRGSTAESGPVARRRSGARVVRESRRTSRGTSRRASLRRTHPRGVGPARPRPRCLPRGE